MLFLEKKTLKFMGYSKESKAIWEKELDESMTILRKCFGNKEIP